MKKLTTLFFVLVFASSMALAQNNDADVDQEGVNQDAEIEQVGSTNTADVDQFTNNSGAQESDVIQLGSDNEATVEQNQTGGGGNALNTAYIKQDGTSNEATQMQTAGGYNGGQSVWGLQDGTGNILNQTISSGYTVSLHAEQVGTNNDVDQDASATHSHGEVYQDGSDHEAVQNLTGSNNGYMGDIMLIDQDGTNQYAKQDFNGSGSSHSNNGSIIQLQSDNEAWQLSSGRDLNATLTQDGVGNWSKQQQTGVGHSSTVTQMGDSNTSHVMQSSGGSQKLVYALLIKGGDPSD